MKATSELHHKPTYDNQTITQTTTHSTLPNDVWNLLSSILKVDEFSWAFRTNYWPFGHGILFFMI